MQFIQAIICRFDNGVPLPLGTATVYLTGTTTKASLFDALGGAISNPVTADGTGLIGFAAANGTYDVICVSADTTYTSPRIVGINLWDANSPVFTSTLANALTVGRNGTTNPAFNVDCSGGSDATGLNVNSAAAGSGLALSVLSSGANENLTIDAKGTGTITIGGTSTGAITHGQATTISSNGANALAVGPNGTSNPTLKVDASTASAATGLSVAGKAAGAGLALAVISSGTNENLGVDAKGSGTINIGLNSTGAITLGRATGISGATAITSTGSSALGVGANGATNPALQVDASTASSATGLKIKSAAAGAGVALSVISSATNEELEFNAKGSGVINIGNASTGDVNFGVKFGYGVSGAGGAVTQATNKSTAVTKNTLCGQITMNAASLAASTSVAFTLNNSIIGANDEVHVWIVSGATAASYFVQVDAVAAGSCRIHLRNVSGGALAEAVVIGFAVRKAVIS